MSAPFLIWSAFHFLALAGNLLKERDIGSTGNAVTTMSWMAWGAMLWNGSKGWFLWTNIPLILLMTMNGLFHLGKPPGPKNEEDASSALWSAAFRLGLVLLCWFLA